jgi:outer membrane protein OmpA-like peptidoglycan-associated protein
MRKKTSASTRKFSPSKGCARGIVEDDLDAVLWWDSTSSSAEGSRGNNGALPVSIEMRRRRQLAAATLPFRGAKIRFRPDRAAFSDQAELALNTVLAELNRDAGLNLLVKAFADAREADELQLSFDRARQVVAWLAARSVDPKGLVAKGCGAA